MKTNIFKKITALTYLIMFLFSFFVPFHQSLASNQIIILTANPSTIAPGGTSTITATLTDATAGDLDDLRRLYGNSITNTFYSNESAYFFSPKTCNITADKLSCSVTFTAGTAAGNYFVSTTTNACSSQSYPFKGVTVSVGTGPISKPTETTYIPLAPLPNLSNSTCKDETGATVPCVDTAVPCALATYLNIMIKIIMGIAAVLAMIMVTMGGIQYMTTELISSKESAKDSISHAILGLLIALGAYILLNTINPQLLNICPKLPMATIVISPEQQQIVNNRTGLGNCTIVTSGNCSQANLNPIFNTTTNATDPLFNANSAQASAICQLESKGVINTPVGQSADKIVDKCSDNKPFSFGLFQINAAAHMSEIPACIGAFNIPSGNQGTCLQSDSKSGVCLQWSCTTNEPAYTNCQNYLINSANNIAFAAKLYEKQGWTPWSTYSSCNSKF